MEPDDFSYFEMSGEDDSLLLPPQIQNDDVSSLSNTIFSCSPLQIPRPNRSVYPPLLSPIGEDNILDSSSPIESSNKENTNSNRSEVPKLSVERQQMKKKKKGGGYNLRKSLAWDRAFFTEEGVLDPSELSMICGNAKFGGETLSVIHEHGGESSSGGRENLLTLEEDLSNELYGSTPNKDSRKGGKFPPRNGSLAGVNITSTSATKRKVFSTQDINRIGAKRSGYPRPVASSSLKRPANVNTTKPAATKEAKSSKMPPPKLASSVLSATAKSTKLGTSTSRKNHVPQQATSAKRNIAASGSSNTNESASKSSVRHARKIAVSSGIKSSTNVRHLQVKKANDASKIKPGATLPASGHTKVSDTSNTNPGSENKHDGCANKVATSVPYCLPPSGGSTHFSKLQTAKPSGLRMPSPSLGFFNQSKASAPHGSLHRSNLACTVLESNVPNIKKCGGSNTIDERPISRHIKLSETTNDVAATSHTRIPSSVEGSVVPTSVKPDSNEKMNSNLSSNDAWKVEEDGPSNSTTLNNVTNQQRLLGPCNDVRGQSQQHAEPCKTGISLAEDNELQINNNKFLFQNANNQSREDNGNERIVNINPLSTDLSGFDLENPDITPNHCLLTEDEGGFVRNDIGNNQVLDEKQCNSSIKSPFASSESQYRDNNGESTYAVLIGLDNGSSCMHDVSDKVKSETSSDQVDEISKDDQRSEFQSCNNAESANSTLKVRCGGSELENSQDLSCFVNNEDARDIAVAVENLYGRSRAGDAEMQFVDVNLSVGSSNDDLRPSTCDNDCVNVADYGNELVANGCEDELKSSTALSSVPCVLQDCDVDVAKLVECKPVENTPSGFSDTQFANLSSQATSAKSRNMAKDQLSGEAAAGSIQLSNVHRNNEDFIGIKPENSLCLTSLPNNIEQYKADLNINDLDECESIEYNQHNVLGKGHPSNSDSEHVIDIERNMLILNNGQFSNIPTINDLSLMENQIPGGYNKCTFKETMPFEEEDRNLKAFNSADFSPDVGDSGRRELGSPHGQHQHQKTEQEMEAARINNKTEKLLAEESQLQCLDEGVLLHSCNNNFNAVALKHKTSMGVDEVQEQSSAANSMLRDFDLVAAAQDSYDARGLYLNDKMKDKNLYSEEMQDGNWEIMMDVVVEQTDSSGNGSRSSILCKQETTAVKDGSDEDQIGENLLKEDKSQRSIQSESSIEHIICDSDMTCGHDDDDEELKIPARSLASDISLMISEEQKSETTNSGKFKSFHPSNEDVGSTVDTNKTFSIAQSIAVNLLKSDPQPEESEKGSPNNDMQDGLGNISYATEDKHTSLSTGSVFQKKDAEPVKSDESLCEAETTISEKNGITNCEMQHELDDSQSAAEDVDVTNNLSAPNAQNFSMDLTSFCDSQKSGSGRKQVDVIIKPPPTAVPFSDEWLAALEAAGEEILTMKSGAVQHSPPEKSQPEPSPWSPVKKKKNQEIGPFDCTKYTNAKTSVSPSD